VQRGQEQRIEEDEEGGVAGYKEGQSQQYLSSKVSLKDSQRAGVREEATRLSKNCFPLVMCPHYHC
jgi:hypothetical protein